MQPRILTAHIQLVDFLFPPLFHWSEGFRNHSEIMSQTAEESEPCDPCREVEWVVYADRHKITGQWIKRKQRPKEVADSELPTWFQSDQQEMESKHWSELSEGTQKRIRTEVHRLAVRAELERHLQPFSENAEAKESQRKHVCPPCTIDVPEVCSHFVRELRRRRDEADPMFFTMLEEVVGSKDLCVCGLSLERCGLLGASR